MRLNKSTSDAIRILIDCARAEGALVKVAAISARLDITMQNVFKIVHILSRADLVAAVRGRNGGVRLARPPEAIRIGDIVRAMETTDLEVDAGAAAGRAGRRGASDVSRVLDSALEAFIGVLDQHTLVDMMGGVAAPPAKSQTGRTAKRRRPARPALVALPRGAARSQPRTKS